MKCDELQERWFEAYPVEGDQIIPTKVYGKKDADDAIAELKRENERLKGDIADLRDDRKSSIAIIDKLNADNKSALEAVSHWHDNYCELQKVVDRLQSKSECKEDKIRILNRALWLARVELCHRLDVDRYLRKHRNSWYNENCLTWAEACVAMEVKMCKAESKCRAKAEEFK